MQRRYDHIDLRVRSLAEARPFYEKQGFETVGNQDFMLGNDRQRDLVMARRLTSDR